MQLTLIGRRNCHLCDVMRVALQAALVEAGVAASTVALVEIDLNDHPNLEGRYSEWVPVLLLGSLEEDREICHYHFDAEQWHAATGLGALQAGSANS